MGRPKKNVPAPVEPEEISQEIPEAEPEFTTDEDAEIEEAKSPGSAISKASAVREALAQGKDSPEEGTDYIRSQYGIEMTRQMFSSYKAQEKARQAKKGGKPAPATETPAPRKRAAAAPAAPAPKVATTGDPALLTDLSAVKHLVERLGAEQVRQIVDLFE